MLRDQCININPRTVRDTDVSETVRSAPKLRGGILYTKGNQDSMNKSPGTPVGSVPNISHDSDESCLGKVGLHGRPTGYCLPLMMKPKDQMKGRRRTSCPAEIEGRE